VLVVSGIVGRGLSTSFFRTNRYDMCASPNTTDDLITGRKGRFCDMLRSNRWEGLDYACGPDGRFFEAK
jgi:hypothetical protein